MNWTNCLQSAASGKCNNEWYDIHYEHENYSATIGVIVGDDTYPSVKFDDNKVNAKATEIGASINNYDIVNTLGEDYIRKTVGAKYEEYLKENDYQGDLVKIYNALFNKIMIHEKCNTIFYFLISIFII